MRYLILLISLCAAAQDLRLRYPLPGETAVTTVQGTVYRTAAGQDLQFDLYRPAGTQHAPVVVFLNGIGAGDLKRWPIYRDWARVVTTQGLAGITMDTRQNFVAEDFRALLDYLNAHSTELRVDAANVQLWACSANVTAGLPIAMDPRHRELRAAVIYYGGGEVKEFRTDLPLLYVRVGTDDPSQVKAMDATVARGLAANAPITMVNLPSARHAFDALDDDPVTRDTIARTLEFLKAHARGDMQQTVSAGVIMGNAVSAVYREDWSAAIRNFDQLVKQQPRNSDVRRRLGDALFRAADYKRAVKEYEQSIALGNGRAPWIAYSAAAASMKSGEHEAALRWIGQFKEVEPLRKRLDADTDFAPLRADPRFRALLNPKAQ